MNRNMEVNAIDWELEARRVKAAFGVDQECHFVQEEEYRVFRSLNDDASDRLKMRDGLILEHYRDEKSQVYFYVSSEEITSSFSIDEWDTNIFVPEATTNIPLVRALFCLGRLTPELEAEFGISLSTHEKIEWIVDFETRLNP